MRWLATVALLLLATPVAASGADEPWVEADIFPDAEGTCHAYDALGDRVLAFCGPFVADIHGHYELGPGSLGEPPLEHRSFPDGDATCHTYDAFGNRVLAYCLRDDVLGSV